MMLLRPPKAEALLLALSLAAMPLAAVAQVQPPQPAPDSLGLGLEALSEEDLQSIQEETGVRVGVLVSKVQAGTPAAKAGIKKGDILVSVGGQGVDSPQAVTKALQGKKGKVDLMLVRPTGEDEFEPVMAALEMTGGAAPRPEAAPGPGGAPGPSGGKPAGKTAAGPADIQAKLDALAAAHDAGILSDEEYAKKKAELESQLPKAAPQIDAETRKKLQALDAAHDAGILSDEEYEKKKAELLARIQRSEATARPQMDEATRKKLQALKEAHDSGILSDEEYERKKAELEAPFQGSAPVDAASAGAPEKEPAVKGKTYTHTIGFTFWYPAEWNVKEHEQGFLQVIPPDPSSNAEGPTELFFIFGESTAESGIKSADDPRLAEYLDTEIRKMAPALSRTGKNATVDMAKGKGVILDWEGKSPKGDVVVARAYTTVIGTNGVALLALCLKDRLAARDDSLRRIFGSFGFGESQKDPQLYGSWLYEKHYFSGTFSSTTVRTMILQSDGRFVTGGQLLASMEHKEAGGQTVGHSSVDSGESKDRGKWAAAGGKLYLLYDDGSYAEYKYSVEGQGSGKAMLLTPSSGDKQLWTFNG